LADILVVASSLALILLPQIGPHHPMILKKVVQACPA
jgi:hypothetical protein